MKKTLACILISIIPCVSIFCQEIKKSFFKIPAQTIQPFLLTKKRVSVDDWFNYRNGPDTTFHINVQPFEISEQVTYGEYKKYLLQILRDSSYDFYLQQLPDSSIGTREVYKEYTTRNKYDNYPVLGIRWDAALEYCKWKTVSENKDSISWIYRMPLYSEWLSAYSYLQKENIENDLNKNYADWLMNLYYEAMIGFSSDTTFKREMVLLHKSSDFPRLKRKLVIGNSYLYQMNSLVETLHGSLLCL